MRGVCWSFKLIAPPLPPGFELLKMGLLKLSPPWTKIWLRPYALPLPVGQLTLSNTCCLQTILQDSGADDADEEKVETGSRNKKFCRAFKNTKSFWRPICWDNPSRKRELQFENSCSQQNSLRSSRFAFPGKEPPLPPAPTFLLLFAQCPRVITPLGLKETGMTATQAISRTKKLHIAMTLPAQISNLQRSLQPVYWNN